jgi:hypothetical protein
VKVRIGEVFYAGIKDLITVGAEAASKRHEFLRDGGPGPSPFFGRRSWPNSRRDSPSSSRRSLVADGMPRSRQLGERPPEGKQ